MADEHTFTVHLVGCVCELCEARAEIERLRALIAAIDEQHVPFDDEGDRGCHECVGLWWPCRTHLLIHPEEARRG